MSPLLHVYVYREGLLARLGHDLRLVVPRFEIALAGDRVTARFDVPSVRVDGAAEGDTIKVNALSEADKVGIRAKIQEEILHADRWPEVTLEGTLVPHAEHPVMRARVTIMGRTEVEDLPVSRIAGVLRVNTVMTPSRWGIKPYKVLAGAIRLQDRWRIQLYLPWEGPLAGLAGAERTWKGVG
jgi:hypothetical protein